MKTKIKHKENLDKNNMLNCLPQGINIKSTQEDSIYEVLKSFSGKKIF